MRFLLTFFIFFIALVLLHWTNITTYYAFLLGKTAYHSEDFNTAAIYFSQGKDKKMTYNLGNSFYKQGKYLKAKDTFVDLVDTADIYTKFSVFHNLGNTYYRLGEQGEADKYWGESIAAYEKALTLREYEPTRKNLEFVKKKLQQVQEKQTQQNNQNTSNNSTQNNNNSEPENGSGKEEEVQNEAALEESSQKSGGNNEKNLTQQEQEALETYMQKLQQDAEYYLDQFDKPYEEENTMQNLFDQFMSNDLQRGGGGEKRDW